MRISEPSYFFGVVGLGSSSSSSPAITNIGLFSYSSRDLKEELVENIARHFLEQDELESNPKYSKFYLSIRKGSPAKKPVVYERIGSEEELEESKKGLQIDGDEGEEDDEDSEIVDEEVEDDDEDEEGGEDNESVDSLQYKVKSLKRTLFGRLEYFKEYLLDSNELVRDVLSTPETVFLIELLFELALIELHYGETIPLYKVSFLPKALKKALPIRVKNLKVFNLQPLLTISFFQLFVTWFLSSVLVPLIASYYFNFSEYLQGYKYDPVIFGIAKLILTLTVVKSSITLSDVKDELFNEFNLPSTVLTHTYFAAKSFFLHGSVELRLIFGNVSIVSTLITTFVAFYSVLQYV